MALQNGTHVKIDSVIVTWDGLSRPEQKDDGSFDWNVGFAIKTNASEMGELQTIVNNAVAAKFPQGLPAGAHPAFRDADTAKFGPLVAGCYTANASTRQGLPPVFDENGKQLTKDDLNGVFYAGCEVSLLVHAYAYDNIKRGVKFGLDGVMIKNRNAPKLDVAAGLTQSDVAGAFGVASVTAPAAAPAAPQAQPVAAPTPPAPQPPAPPANDLASGKIMLPAAQGVAYDEYIKAGWTDEQLIANGLMQG